MNMLQLPPRLELTVTPQSSWTGIFYLKPEASDKFGDLLLHETRDIKTLSISLGSKEVLSAAVFRNAGVKVATWLTQNDVPDVGLLVSDFDTSAVENALEAFCQGLLLGSFRFDRHKSDAESTDPVKVRVLTNGNDAAVKDKLDRVSTIISGVNLAREWSHEPPNIINPITLGKRARELAAKTGLTCTILGETELTNMGAGAILSVGLGSKTQSQMIILEHKVAQGETPPVVIVGKAITFDTGGYSLKDKAGIVGMKFDKCGGMDVFGIMQAVAKLNLPMPVVGIVAAAENMISQDAYRPNDIITSLSGKTIEIISTDAEGRMVLADALTYATKQYKPRAIIDLATLTGGVRTALGRVRAGLMSNDEKLANELFAVGEHTNERLWPLPLDNDYFELIKGTDSDIKNSAGVPYASPIVGGIFLKQFVPDDIPWAHIDIAGTATVEISKGIRLATGFGVRLIVELLTKF